MQLSYEVLGWPRRLFGAYVPLASTVFSAFDCTTVSITSNSETLLTGYGNSWEVRNSFDDQATSTIDSQKCYMLNGCITWWGFSTEVVNYAFKSSLFCSTLAFKSSLFRSTHPWNCFKTGSKQNLRIGKNSFNELLWNPLRPENIEILPSETFWFKHLRLLSVQIAQTLKVSYLHSASEHGWLKSSNLIGQLPLVV